MKDEYKEMVCRVRFIDGVPAQTYLSDVEIVRCKDCRYYDGANCTRKQGCRETIPEGFCGWAIPKKGAEHE